MPDAASALEHLPKGRFDEAIRNLEKAVARSGGNSRLIFELLAADCGYLDRAASFLQEQSRRSPIPVEQARELLGNHIFDHRDWETFYGARFSDEELAVAGTFPWSDKVLCDPCPFVKGKTIRETHFAFLGIRDLNGTPLTLNHLKTLHKEILRVEKPDLVDDPVQSQRTCHLGWYLMPLGLVPDSVRRGTLEQAHLLPPGCGIPTAVEEIVKRLLYFQKTGLRLNDRDRARCYDLTQDGYRVLVVDAGRTMGLGTWSDGAHPWIALAAFRMLPLQAMGAKEGP